MGSTLSVGDLVLVRDHPTYQIGAIVANPGAGDHLVVHRVIARDGDRYVTQGDANPSPDPFHPTADEILGEVWIRIPKFGAAITWVRTPAGASMLAGLFVVIVGAGSRRRRRPTRSDPKVGGRGVPSASLREAGGALALGGILLAILGMTAPLRADGERAVTTATTFRTGGQGIDPLVYPGLAVRDGQPWFLALIRSVGISTTTKLSSDAPISGVEGTYRLRAMVETSTGWDHREKLAHGPVTSASFEVITGVPFARLAGVLGRFEETTGEQEGLYPLRIELAVNVRGLAGGIPFSEEIVQTLAMKMDQRRAFLDRGVDGLDPRTVQHTTLLSLPGAESGRVQLLGVGVPALALRVAGVLAALLGLLLLWGSAASGRRSVASDDPVETDLDPAAEVETTETGTIDGGSRSFLPRSIIVRHGKIATSRDRATSAVGREPD